MLTNTFCHIPGIGAKTERRLWESGVLSWDTVRRSSPLPLAEKTAQRLKKHVEESDAELAGGNPDYFYERLPAAEQWRMFPEFQRHVAYLDIETTGLGGPGGAEDYITTIALFDGHHLKTYVHDDNLLDFKEDIERYRLIVTYNGKCFDVPFIREYLGIPMRHAHIDLRYVLASLGYRGGLKGCETQLGLDRRELADVDGFFAVLLWYDFHHNANERALETLLAYNALDAVNLATLMALSYNLKIKETPYAESHRLPLPQPAMPPFKADLDTIERIKREHGW